MELKEKLWDFLVKEAKSIPKLSRITGISTSTLLGLFEDKKREPSEKTQKKIKIFLEKL